MVAIKNVGIALLSFAVVSMARPGGLPLLDSSASEDTNEQIASSGQNDGTSFTNKGKIGEAEINNTVCGADTQTHCCDTVQNEEEGDSLLALGLEDILAAKCTPISAIIGLGGGADCRGGTAACCQNQQQFGGSVISLQCNALGLGVIN